MTSSTRCRLVNEGRLWPNRPAWGVAPTVLTAKPQAIGRTDHHVVVAQKQTAYGKHVFLLEYDSSPLVLDLAANA